MIAPFDEKARLVAEHALCQRLKDEIDRKGQHAEKHAEHDQRAEVFFAFKIAVAEFLAEEFCPIDHGARFTSR